MALSECARNWLARLDRRPAPGAEAVELALREHEAPVSPVWLDFQERYAGYVEPIAADIAVWGLIHDSPSYLRPRQLELEYDRAEESWLIVCADAHPSYDYVLDERGTLGAGPAANVDTHIERLAARDAFCAAGAPPKLDFNVKDRVRIDAIEARTRVLPEASDRFFEIRLADDMLAIWEHERQRWIEVLSR